MLGRCRPATELARVSARGLLIPMGSGRCPRRPGRLLEKGTEGLMPSWMSRLPITTADISAATATESDDLVRAVTSIAVITVHGLSATASENAVAVDAFSLGWLLLVSYRLGSRFRGSPVFVRTGVRFHASAVFMKKWSEAAVTSGFGAIGANLPEAALPGGRVCALADEGVTMSYKYRTVRVRGTELVGTIARKHGSTAEIYETSRDLSTSVVPVFFEATGEIRFRQVSAGGRCGTSQLTGLGIPGQARRPGVWDPFHGGNGGVDNVHTFALEEGRTSVGLARIPHVFAGSQCLQGLEDSSSPTSGTVFPQVTPCFIFGC